MQTTSFRLDNGLLVLLRETHHNPVVTVDAWVNTGSINEPPELQGVSHFLEHMLFKGTERRRANELDLMIESVGGSWNAGTSKDFTHYYCTVASPHREVAVDAVADMLRNSTLDAAELEKERLVILEEYLRKQDNPSGLIWDEMYEAAWEDGPYRHEVLGTEATIKGITREGMRDYFERYYGPENIVVIMAGDITLEQTRTLAERHFSGWNRPYRPLKLGQHRAGKRARGNRRILERDVNETYYAMSFPGPAIGNEEDALALDLLEAVLSEGGASRLHLKLVEDLEIAHGVGAGCVLHRHDGMFVFSAVLDEQHLDAVRREALAEMERIKTELPTERELERVKTMIFTSLAFRTETTAGQTAHIGYYRTLTGSTAYAEHYAERLLRVPREEISRVARLYLDASATNEVIIRPKKSGTPNGTAATS